MPRIQKAKSLPGLYHLGELVASVGGGSMQQTWQEPLLLRVTGGGGSAGTAAERDPPALILADGTQISFTEHH